MRPGNFIDFFISLAGIRFHILVVEDFFCTDLFGQGKQFYLRLTLSDYQMISQRLEIGR